MNKKFILGLLCGVLAGFLVCGGIVVFGILGLRRVKIENERIELPATSTPTTVKAATATYTPTPTETPEIVLPTATPTLPPRSAMATVTPTPRPTATPIPDPIGVNEILDQELVNKIIMLANEISTGYYKDVSKEELRNGLLKGLMNAVGDPYTVYYTPEEYNALRQSTSGVYAGVGAYITQKAGDNFAVFKDPFEGGPAYKAGVMTDDIIYMVDGEVVFGLTTSEIADRVRGPEGTKVKITVYRESINDYVHFEIERATVDSPTVVWEVLEGNVGYIQVTEFDNITDRQYKEAIDALTEKEVKGIIVDLRNNGGGVLDVCVRMADYMVPDGLVITSTLDKYGEGDEYVGSDGHYVRVPVVVLVNGNSASASEVFTGALKDNWYGTVMGTQTFGKGIVQSIYPLRDGSAIKITTSSYYTPDGICIHGIGITPDITVEPDGETDNQKEEARKFILEYER